MAVRPGARAWTVREQSVDDPASGLSFMFETVGDGTARLHVYGDLPFGNRTIALDVEGEEAGEGGARTGLCRPTWMV